jgi:hypothetical protein
MEMSLGQQWVESSHSPKPTQADFHHSIKEARLARSENRRSSIEELHRAKMHEEARQC